MQADRPSSVCSYAGRYPPEGRFMKWSAVLGFTLVCGAHAGTILFDNSNPAFSAGNRAIALVAEYRSHA